MLIHFLSLIAQVLFLFPLRFNFTSLHPDWMLLLSFTHTHVTITVTLAVLFIPKVLTVDDRNFKWIINCFPLRQIIANSSLGGIEKYKHMYLLDKKY